MRNSYINPGRKLPETLQEFIDLCRDGKATFTRCFDCKRKFCPEIVYTSQGWAETQISGTCEECFDLLFPKES